MYYEVYGSCVCVYDRSCRVFVVVFSQRDRDTIAQHVEHFFLYYNNIVNEDFLCVAQVFSHI